MIAHSVGHKLDEVGFLFLQDKLTGFSGGFPTGKGIISVNSGTGDTHGDGSGDDTVRGVLIFSGSGDGVLVVSAEEKGLTLESGSKVKSNSKVALTGSTLPNITSSNLLFITDPHGISRTSSLRNLSC